MTTTENTKQQLIELKDRIENIIAGMDKPQYEVGRWYWAKNKTGNYLFNYQEDTSGFGFWFNGNWESSWITSHNWGNCSITPATPDEVKEALVKEAEKMGFKEGVKVKRPEAWGWPFAGAQTISIQELGYKYDSNCDRLFLGGTCIYSKGQWAEIVKGPKVIWVGNSKVEFINDKAYFTNQNLAFSRSQIQTILDGFDPPITIPVWGLPG